MNRDHKRTGSRANSRSQAQSKQEDLASKEKKLKEFKLQIDNEIAKCLDTLDRQGLNYLKQTLYTSKIFDIEDLRILSEHQTPASEQIEEEILEQVQPIDQPRNSPSKPNAGQGSQTHAYRQENKDNQQDKAQIDQLVEKIKSLPQEKVKELGLIIQKLEKNQNVQSFTSYQQRPPMKMGSMSSHSARPHSGKQKNSEKATSLYNCIMKQPKSPKPVEIVSDEISSEEIEQQIATGEVEQVAAVQKKPSLEPITERVAVGEKQEFKKSGLLKKFSMMSNSQTKKLLDVNLTESKQMETNQFAQNKMVKVGKKKLGSNRVQIILLRNRGHPSIIGLTGIALFNSQGNPITVKIDNVKAPSGVKVMRLFDGINKTVDEDHMFEAVLKRDFQIELDIPEKIGAIKIWNFNKSEIESSKETDWMEIYINGKEVWQGLIQKGCYNEHDEYETTAFLQDDVVLSDFSKGKELTVQGEFQMDYSLPKSKKPKVDWLERTLVEEKMKELSTKEVKEVKDDESKNKRGNRFSQLFQDKNAEMEIQSPVEKTMQKVNSYLNLKKDETREAREAKAFSKYSANEHIDSLYEKVTPQRVESPFRKISETKELEKKQKKKIHEQSIDEFMNDSVFQEPNLANVSRQQKLQKLSKKTTKKYENDELKLSEANAEEEEDTTREEANRQYQRQQEKRLEEKRLQEKRQEEKRLEAKKQSKGVDLEELLNELDDLVGAKKTETKEGQIMKIPQLPGGKKMIIIIEQNWGDHQYLGLNKLEFFSDEGKRVFPTAAWECSNKQKTLGDVVSKREGINNRQSQWKIPKRGEARIQITFDRFIRLSLIRFWNYIGDRVHSMIGVSKVKIFWDDRTIFRGEIQKITASSTQDSYKWCENILMTNNIQILRSLADSDWLSKELQGWREEEQIFRKTIDSFHKTNSDERIVVPVAQSLTKPPKRNCFEYDPPITPMGCFLKLAFHSCWGDQKLIGLDAIEIYDDQGNQIKGVKNVIDFPSGGSQVGNLFRKKTGQSGKQGWISEKLSDVGKMQKSVTNSILIQFSNAVRIGVIKIYNCSKNPQRGVREISVYLDNYLCYWGFLRRVDTENLFTTICFTKDTEILQKVGYSGYHEDGQRQAVLFYNEGRQIASN